LILSTSNSVSSVGDETRWAASESDISNSVSTLIACLDRKGSSIEALSYPSQQKILRSARWLGTVSY